MEIRLLCVGKIKKSYPLNELIAFYLKRLRHLKVNIIEIAATEPETPKELEQLWLHKIQRSQNHAIWALDQRGECFSEHQWAEHLQKNFLHNTPPTLLIGGSTGLPASTLSHVQQKVSLGPVTWNHQIMRVLLLDILYRCEKIWENHPYAQT